MAKAMTSPTSGFSLADLIESTANELREAHKRPRQGDAVMEFKGCELKLAVTVKGEAGAGIRFWVVDASTKVAAERVSKIKLSLGPLPTAQLWLSRLPKKEQVQPIQNGKEFRQWRLPQTHATCGVFGQRANFKPTTESGSRFDPMQFKPAARILRTCPPSSRLISPPRKGPCSLSSIWRSFNNANHSAPIH